METRLSRNEWIAGEICSLGVPSEIAERISQRLVVQHPLARRVGVPGIARWLRRAGAADERAQECAAVLFALDAIDLHRAFPQVVRELCLAGLAPHEAQGAAFEAARIHRSTVISSEEPELPIGMIAAGIASITALFGVFLFLLG
jgi:hypothetical protein